MQSISAKGKRYKQQSRRADRHEASLRRQIAEQRPALEKRCRLMGLPPTLANVLSVRLTDSSQAGLAIMTQANEAGEMWRAFCSLARAYTAFRKRYLGVDGGRHPIQAMMERQFGVDLSASPDTRTAEEKDRAAIDGWRYWQDVLRQADAGEQFMEDAVTMQVAPLVENGVLNVRGRVFVAAMGRVVREIARREGKRG